jgi:hypothetical protein
MTAIVVIAAVSLPWFVLVGLRTDGQWLVGFFGEHNFKRILEPNYNHRGPIFYHVLGALIGMFPWSVFLPLALVQLGQRLWRRESSSTADLFTACWAIAYFLPFSIASTKLPNYVLPAYPALALAIGLFLDRWLREPSTVRSLWPRMAFSATALGGVVMSVALCGVGYFLMQAPQSGATLHDRETLLHGAPLHGGWTIGLIGLLPLVGGVVAQALYVSGRPRGAMVWFSFMAVGFATLAFGYTAQDISYFHSTARLAIDWRERLGPSTPLAGFRHQAPSEVYYSGRTLPNYWEPADVKRFFATQPDGCLLTWAHEYRALAEALPDDVRVLDRRPRFLRRGEILLIGRPRNEESHLETAEHGNSPAQIARQGEALR